MSDLISRADAIEVISKHGDLPFAWWKMICRELKDLPSAELTLQTPQTYGKSINPSSAEVVEDIISRADAICEVLVNDGIDNIVDRINALPSAEQVTSKLKKPCDSLLTEDSADAKEHKSKLEHDRDWIIGCIEHDGFIKTDRFDKANQIILDALSADAVQGWIPFTRRPMTEEEQKNYPNCTFMFDCVLPDDGDEILVSNGRFVWMDTFCNDIDGCYLDSGDDIDEDMAWMPLPKPYKGGDDE